MGECVSTVLLAIILVGQPDEASHRVSDVLRAWKHLSQRYVVGEKRLRHAKRDDSGNIIEQRTLVSRVTPDGYCYEIFDER